MHSKQALYCKDLKNSWINNYLRVINHFSHNGEPIQHKLENQVGKHVFLVAYDGFTVEIG